jgi:DNA-binding transcriptional regulator LsrR (DeoR family)
MMNKYQRGADRDELLAETAELYYEQGLTQGEVAKTIGMTRSAVSRLLTEAREKGIVEIKVHHPFRFDAMLEQELQRRFKLLGARVLIWPDGRSQQKLLARLGEVAATELQERLGPATTLGIAWGTGVNSTIDALTIPDPIPATVVQLVGVLGSGDESFNAQALVDRLARKIGGRGVYLYSPFILENAVTAQSVRNTSDVAEAIAVGRSCDTALLGIGTILDTDYSTLYQGGHIDENMRAELLACGAVGDVCAHHFDRDGRLVSNDFHERLVGISGADLRAIPWRLGVAGGLPKATAILGALRGGYVNWLVTDSATAERVLELDGWRVS